jgi:hypothetical protein
VVLDNLNTRFGAALNLAFKAQEARRLVERFELHYTLKHGSWLNIADIELSALTHQCPDYRIPDKDTSTHEVKAREDQ